MSVELDYFTLSKMPIAINATTPIPPNPHGESSSVWSTTEKCIVSWDGTKWVGSGSSVSTSSSERPSVSPILLNAFVDSKTVNPKLTLSSSAGSTYVNSLGVIVSAPANFPRINYDFVTLECKGLLLEESRTNLVLHSTDVSNAAWIKTSNGVGSLPIVTPNYGRAPDGTLTASRVQLALNSGVLSTDISRVYQPVVITNSSTYSNSVYVKTADGSTKTILFSDDSGGISPVTQQVVVNGTWKRISATATAINTISNACGIWLRGGQGTSNSADLLIWGGQLENGEYASSFSYSDNTPFTRSTDRIFTTNFSNIFNPSEGTFYMEFEKFVASNIDQYILEASASSPNSDFFSMYSSSNSDSVVMSSNNGATSYPQILSSSAAPVNTITRAALAYSNTIGKYGIVNGTSIINGTGIAELPTNPITSLYLGGTSNDLSIKPLSGHLRRFAYYTKALPYTEMIALTSS